MMYHPPDMRTVLISGSAPPPEGLREIMERGSTSLLECRAGELVEPLPFDADRIVFWSAPDDVGVRSLAEKYAKADRAERRESVMFVTSVEGAPAALARLAPEELFIWPRDEDRLKMAFLTGA